MISRDTIFALSTPRGKSAIAVFRITGPKSHSIIKKISSLKKIEPNKSVLGHIFDNRKKIIDKCVFVLFKSPKSFTGENMVEISCHGSIAIIKKLSYELQKTGMRIAEPGEFTRRSLENDKIDLTQVEAMGDLINAKTEKKKKLANF